MVKRIIFDIDYTLLKPNYDVEYQFLQQYVDKDNDYFIYHMGEILRVYETVNFKYELNGFLDYLNKFSNGRVLDERFLKEWINFSSKVEKQDLSIVSDTLAYLQEKYELVVLSNWIREAQIKKLENTGLLHFFSEVYGGDSGLKPFYQSYMQVIGNHSPDECIMIGDNLALDVIGALNAGLQAIHYTNGKEVEHNYPKVKCLSELKKLL